MEIRVLRYFLEIAREENMTRAAEYLHVSQPTLSKQMKELETELGKKLFHRGSSIRLTNEGVLLRKRAEDILAMVDKTTDEFSALGEITGGEVQIGCAESHQIKYLARVIKAFQQKYPLFRYHLSSGNTEQVTERLDRGLIDFAVIVEPPNLSGTINLAYNGSVFVKEGLGYMLTFDRLIDTGSDAHLFKRVDRGSCRTNDLRFFADVEF